MPKAKCPECSLTFEASMSAEVRCPICDVRCKVMTMKASSPVAVPVAPPPKATCVAPLPPVASPVAPAPEPIPPPEAAKEGPQTEAPVPPPVPTTSAPTPAPAVKHAPLWVYAALSLLSIVCAALTVLGIGFLYLNHPKPKAKKEPAVALNVDPEPELIPAPTLIDPDDKPSPSEEKKPSDKDPDDPKDDRTTKTASNTTLPGTRIGDPKEKPIKPDSTPPKEEKPTPIKLDSVLDVPDLLKIPEFDFFPVVRKVEEGLAKSQIKGKNLSADEAALAFSRDNLSAEFKMLVGPAVTKAGRDAGLPLGMVAMADKDIADNISTIAQELRRLGMVSYTESKIAHKPGVDGPSAEDRKPRITSKKAVTEFEKWFDEKKVGKYKGGIETLEYMLQTANERKRVALVDACIKTNTKSSTQALARRLLFDGSKELREKALEALKERNPKDYRPVFLQALNYPLLPVAENAAAALVALNDREAVPQLVEALKAPSPELPFVIFRAKKPYRVVRELIRINTLRNCYLCHPAVPADPVASLPRDQVPGMAQLPGRAIDYAVVAKTDDEDDPKQSYRFHVRANMAFLAPDFSVSLPVEEADPWPRMQRYDFLIRFRPATEEEIARVKTPPETYPQREAVLAALRKLSGTDHGKSTDAWVKALDQLKKDIGKP